MSRRTLLAGAACAVVSTSAPAQSLGQQGGNLPGTIAHRIGRFQFQTGPELQTSGRSQRIYRVSATVLAGNAQALMDRRIVEIRERAARLGRSDPMERIFRPTAGAVAAWHHERPEDKSKATLEWFVQTGDRSLYLSREISAGDPAVAEKLFGQISEGYRPAAQTGFFLEQGALTTEHSRYEETAISLAHADHPQLKLRLNTDTLEQPDTRDLLKDALEEKQAIEMSGGSVDILQNRRRALQHMQGVETKVALKFRDAGQTLRYTWRSPGEARSATAPHTLLRGEAPIELKSELDAVWSTFIDTLKSA